jgi:hypothetical protein
MAGLAWVRLDTNWPHNPKFLMLAQDKKWRAIAVYMGGLAYSGGQGLDGFVPFYALPLVNGTKREASDLIAASLWHPCDGGWQIHDWRDHQESNEETERRSKKAQDAAMVRWHGTKNAPSNAPSMLRALPAKDA